MIITKRTATVAAALLTLGATFGPSLAAVADTAPTSPVLDGANMLTPAQERDLTAAIDTADKRYKLEFVVETITSLDGRDIQQLATDRANELGVGSAELDNGVYTLIARDDHGIQIALGSGVDGKVSNATVEQIIADDMTPAFRDEQYVQGIEAAQNEIGDYYTTDRAASEAAAAQRQAAENERVGATITSVLLWVAIVIGSLLGLAGLIWLTRVLVTYVIEERARKRNIRHRVAVEGLTSELYNLSEPEQAEFHALANDAARQQWLAPRLAKYTERDADFADDLYARAMSAYSTNWTGEIEKELNMHWTRQRPYRFDARSTSLHDFFTKFLSDSRAEKERQQREAKAQAERERIAREQRKAAEAERKRVQAQREADAKREWAKFTPAQKAAVKSARTRRDKERVLSGYGVDSTNLAVWFPIWLATYSSEVGQPQSDYSHRSSSASSSSSSPSYSSSDFGSSSSFGGGSFDGGGGGGSW